VYFIRDTKTLAIKIGFCLKNPEKRLAALQTGNCNDLRLLGSVSGSLFHEKLLHAQFSQFHVQGEWFSDKIVEGVTGILKCPSIEEWLKGQEASPPV
jgi:hypothetical protein